MWFSSNTFQYLRFQLEIISLILILYFQKYTFSFQLILLNCFLNSNIQAVVDMQNNILRNQKQLYGHIPIAQLGSKFSRLNSRLGSRVNHPPNMEFSKKDKCLSQHFCLDSQDQNPIKKGTTHVRAQSSLQPAQLQYFKSINSQVMRQNLILRQDLRICNLKLNKISQERRQIEEQLLVHQKTNGLSQRKIIDLMEYVHRLIIMVKDKFLDRKQSGCGYQTTSQSTLDKQSQANFVSSFEEQKGSLENQLEKIKKFTESGRNPKKFKKKSQNSLKDTRTKTRKGSNLFTFSQQSQLGAKTPKQKNVIGKTFVHQCKQKAQQPEIGNSQKQAKSYKLKQIGTQFTATIERKKEQLNSHCKIHSNVFQLKIKPTQKTLQLYSSIKQIFDHQIYLLQKKKMSFLQHKNRRLLKFIYQCSGCERYQQMFSQIFRILREGFKEIKFKIMPQLRNKKQDYSQIIF